MKEIAKEHQIEWDTEESEKELLKAPEEMIVSSSLSLSLSHTHTQEAQLDVSYKNLNTVFFIRRDHTLLLVPPVYP
jgi:vacuolar protein sorting-associated protein IST1